MTHGTLYIVATPLGNLEDITFRAVNVLKQADLIAAEDTRHSKKLLAHYGITTPLASCHEHNEKKKVPSFINRLKEGQTIALISDAGTPCVSDPGYLLVKQAATEGIPVLPVPGCSAVIAGLSVSGLPTDAFMFLGFLPRKASPLDHTLQSLADIKATLIVYESPRRIKNIIQAMISTWGDRPACLAREISKLHEEYIRGSLSEILVQLGEKDRIRGECALFIGGNTKRSKTIDETRLKQLIKTRLAESEIGTSDLAKELSDATGLSRKKIYQAILNVRKEDLGPERH